MSCNGAPQPCNRLPVARNRRDGYKNGQRNALSRADTDERHTRTGTVTFRRFDRALSRARARPRMRARPSQRAPTFPPWPGNWPLRLGPVGPAAVALAAPPPPSRARARAPVRSVICTISAAAAGGGAQRNPNPHPHPHPNPNPNPNPSPNPSQNPNQRVESEAEREAEYADQQVAHLVKGWRWDWGVRVRWLTWLRVGVGVEVSGLGIRSGSMSG